MKFIGLITCVFALGAGGADSLYLTKKEASPAVITLPLQIAVLPGDVLSRRALSRRVEEQPKPLNQQLNSGRDIYGYITEIQVGSHRTPIQLIIDTGSGDTIIQVAQSNYCQKNGGCTRYGTVDVKSDSLILVKEAGIQIMYVSGKAAIADLVKDVIRIGGRAVPHALFGIAVGTTFEYNILGLGYAANEAVVEGDPPYMNFLQMMKENGVIKSAAYSLSLSSQNVGGGSILFGGVDTGKFKGKLATLAVQGDRRELVINVSGISFAGEKQGSLNAVVDAGQTSISVADELAKKIWAAAAIKSLDETGYPIRSCELTDAESRLALVFKFVGTIIRVPMSELIIPDSTGANARLDEGSCYFGVYGSGGDIAVLGMPFLRSAYVLFNLESNEISLAPPNFNGGSKIREIADGGVASLGALADGVADGTLNAENANLGSGDNTISILNGQPLGGDGSLGAVEIGGTSIPNPLAFNPYSNTQSTPVATASPVDNPSSDGSGSTNIFDSSMFSSTGSSGTPDFSTPADATGAKTQQPNQASSQMLGGDVSNLANTGGTMNPNSSPPFVQVANSNAQFLSPPDFTNWVSP